MSREHKPGDPFNLNDYKNTSEYFSLHAAYLNNREEEAQKRTEEIAHVKSALPKLLREAQVENISKGNDITKVKFYKGIPNSNRETCIFTEDLMAHTQEFAERYGYNETDVWSDYNQGTCYYYFNLKRT